MSSQAKIRNTPFDQKSPGHPEVDVLRLRAQGGGSIDFFLKQGSYFFLKIVSAPPNIRNMFFDQRSPRPPEVGVLGLRA